jgi:hypothetical protein
MDCPLFGSKGMPFWRLPLYSTSGRNKGYILEGTLVVVIRLHPALSVRTHRVSTVSLPRNRNTVSLQNVTVAIHLKAFNYLWVSRINFHMSDYSYSIVFSNCKTDLDIWCL